MRSTTELKRHLCHDRKPRRDCTKSGRRDSNPRPSAWKANALSTELLPQIQEENQCPHPDTSFPLSVRRGGFEPPKAKPADLQSAPVGHFGICASYLTPAMLTSARISLECGCKCTTKIQIRQVPLTLKCHFIAKKWAETLYIRCSKKFGRGTQLFLLRNRLIPQGYFYYRY